MLIILQLFGCSGANLVSEQSDNAPVNPSEAAWESRVEALKDDAKKYRVAPPVGFLTEASVSKFEQTVAKEKKKLDELFAMYTEVVIPAGSFTMGCTFEEEGHCSEAEKPSHQVSIRKPFFIMKHEVTQELFEHVTRMNPSQFKGRRLPVENVSWYETARFANSLSFLERRQRCYEFNEEETAKWVKLAYEDCDGWRLPTEAEWEYASRGGAEFKYAGSDILSEVAWYGQIQPSDQDRTVLKEGTKEVCIKKTNGYGLCDMSGNVAEWVWDWYDEDFYASSSLYDPKGPEFASPTYGLPAFADELELRVIRGGSWFSTKEGLRVSARDSSPMLSQENDIGFRLVRTQQSRD